MLGGGKPWRKSTSSPGCRDSRMPLMSLVHDRRVFSVLGLQCPIERRPVVGVHDADGYASSPTKL